MSSGEEFEVDEILEERKRKGVLEYLVRWKGFNDLYDSWEPASGLADCTKALKAFTAKLKRSRSKSRSRSRGRASKSRSRSSSRSRTTKKTTEQKRSRSRSGGRKTRTTRSSSKISEETTVVTKKEEQATSSKQQSGEEEEEEKVTKKSETVVEKKAAATKEGQVVEQKTEVVKTTVETVKSAPSMKSESSGMTTRSRMVVRQVENDQKPAPKATETVKGEEKGTWLWWFADHAVLLLFIVVSLIALSFSIESLSGVRDKLVPDLGILRQRLGECFDHFVQALAPIYNYLAAAAMSIFTSLNIFFTGGDGPEPAQTPTNPPPPAA